jgi:rhodanese-related sulfurtransferase
MRKAIFAAALAAFVLGAALAAPRLPALLDEKGLVALLAAKDARVLLLDVRTAEEYAAGHIPGAVLFPYDELAGRFREPDKGRPIVVYCRTGRRSAIARETLMAMGYTNVSDFGAYTKWSGKLATN